MSILNTTMAASLCIAACACATPQKTALASDTEIVSSVENSSSQPSEKTDAVPSETKSADNQAKDRMICKTEDVTGSRFPKKTCRPASQWQEMKTESKKTLERLQRRPG